MGAGRAFSAWKRLHWTVLCGACWGGIVLEARIGSSVTRVTGCKPLVTGGIAGGREIPRDEINFEAVGSGTVMGVVDMLSVVGVASERMSGDETDLGM
jgi:hypothetical protein